MKGGKNLTKKEAKRFLNVCKNVDIIKFNGIIKRNKLSQSSISRFLNSDIYDDMISLKQLEILIYELYNGCLFIVDMYNENITREKIA